jgi:two-component system nitrate/nitrite response regulator NarL
MLNQTSYTTPDLRGTDKSGDIARRVTVIGGNALFRHGLEGMLGSFGFEIIQEDDQPIGLALIVADGLTPPALSRVVDEMRRSGAMHTAGVLAEPSVGDLSAALCSGLDGLMAQSMSPEALRRSIELVLMGENVFPTRMAISGPNIGDEDDLADALGVSVRDLSMLRLLAKGLSNRVISGKTGLPESMVKSQVRQALARIGADNRTQAALWAIERGLEEDQGRAG